MAGERPPELRGTNPGANTRFMVSRPAPDPVALRDLRRGVVLSSGLLPVQAVDVPADLESAQENYDAVQRLKSLLLGIATGGVAGQELARIPALGLATPQTPLAARMAKVAAVGAGAGGISQGLEGRDPLAGAVSGGAAGLALSPFVVRRMAAIVARDLAATQAGRAALATEESGHPELWGLRQKLEQIGPATKAREWIAQDPEFARTTSLPTGEARFVPSTISPQKMARALGGKGADQSPLRTTFWARHQNRLVTMTPEEQVALERQIIPELERSRDAINAAARAQRRAMGGPVPPIEKPLDMDEQILRDKAFKDWFTQRLLAGDIAASIFGWPPASNDLEPGMKAKKER